MKILRLLLFFFFLAATTDESKLQKMTWQVDGVTREALVYLPPNTDAASPIIFAFHGHGATAQFSARKFAFQTLWPSAITVYPQGLPTKTIIDPEGKRPGWQKAIGDDQDRDLHFFDAMLQTFVKEHHADAHQVFITGHSNGAFFTYCLLCARPKAITAIAPIAGLNNERDLQSAEPKPIFHVAGEIDPMVHFNQQQLTIQRDFKLNHCDPTGQPDGPFCTRYSSKDHPPVITLIHPGGHEIPKPVPQRIVQFFQQQSPK